MNKVIITKEEEAIYRKVLHAYRLSDAETYFEAELESGEYTKEQKDYLRDNVDYEYLVRFYEDNSDCNIDEFSTWSFVVDEHIHELLSKYNKAVKHGHWQVWYHGNCDFSYSCSNCCIGTSLSKTPYCPYCGSKMDR